MSNIVETTIDTKFYTTDESIEASDTFRFNQRGWLQGLRLQYYDQSKKEWVGKGGWGSRDGVTDTDYSTSCDYGTLSYHREVSSGGWWDTYHDHTFTFTTDHPENMPPGEYRIAGHTSQSNTFDVGSTDSYNQFTVWGIYGVRYYTKRSGETQLFREDISEGKSSPLSATKIASDPPSGEGYTFRGWLINGTVYQPGQSIIFTGYGVLDAEAIWVRAINIHYESKAIDAELPTDQVIETGNNTEIVTVQGAPTLSASQQAVGWQFSNWNISKAGSGYMVNGEGQVELTPGDYIATAVWRLSWTYDLAGGNINGNTEQVRYTGTVVSKDVDILRITPTRQGYKLTGWSDIGGNPVDSPVDVTGYTSPIVFTALWSRLVDEISLELSSSDEGFLITPKYIQHVDNIPPEEDSVTISVSGPLEFNGSRVVTSTYNTAVPLARMENTWDRTEADSGVVRAVATDGSGQSVEKTVYIYKLFKGSEATIIQYILADEEETVVFDALPMPDPIDGYNTNGWNLSEALYLDVTEAPEASTSMQVAAGKYVTSAYPVYYRYRYKIAFLIEGQGVNIDQSSPQFQTVERFSINSRYPYEIPLAKPVSRLSDRGEGIRTGEFTGWKLDNSSEIYAPDATIAALTPGDHTLTAVWIQYQHIISLRGSTEPLVQYADAVQEICIVKASDLQFTTLPRGASGWASSIDGEEIGISLQTDAQTTINSQNCEIYAIYYPTYTVRRYEAKSTDSGQLTYELMDSEILVVGNGPGGAGEYRVPSQMNIPDVIRTTGYRETKYSWTFIGFSTATNGVGDIEAESTRTISEDEELYPIYSLETTYRSRVILNYAGGGAYDRLGSDNLPQYYGTSKIQESVTWISEWAESTDGTVTGTLASGPEWPGTLIDLDNRPQFSKWKLEETEYDAGAEITLAEGEYTLYAEWIAHYSLKYDIDASLGESIAELPSVIEGDLGQEPTTYAWNQVSIQIEVDPQDVIREGWEYIAWARVRTDELVTTYAHNSTINVSAGQNVVLYPHGKSKIHYELVYKVPTVEDTNSVAETTEESYTFNLSAPGIIPEGYTFYGWATAIGSTVTITSGQYTFKLSGKNRVDQRKELYAVLRPKYTIHAAYTDNTGTPSTQEIPEGTYTGREILDGDPIAYSKWGSEETKAIYEHISRLPPKIMPTQQGWTTESWTGYQRCDTDLSSDVTVEVRINRYITSEYTITFKAVLADNILTKVRIVRPLSDGGWEEVYSSSGTVPMGTEQYELPSLSIQFSGKTYHATRYTVKKDNETESESIAWSGSGESYTLDTQHLSYEFTIYTAYNEFTLKVNKGKNPNGTVEEYNSTMEYYVRSDNSVGTRFKDRSDSDNAILKLEWITSDYVTLQNNGYMFSGLAHAPTNDVVYSVGQALPAITDGTQYISRNGTVILYALWGVGVADYTVGYSVQNNRLTAQITLLPLNAANKSILPMQVVDGNETAITGTSSSPKLVSQTVKENVVTMVFEYAAGPVEQDEIIFRIQGKADNTLADPRIFTRYAYLDFVNDAGNALNMLMPAPIVYLTCASDQASLSGETVELNYSALANSKDHSFVGWTLNRSAFGLEGDTELVQTLVLGETTSQGYTGAVQLYPVWEMDVRFDLNGGTWAEEATDILYCGTYTGLHDGNTVDLGSISNPIHPTKRFMGWNAEYRALPKAPGIITISAMWRVRDLVWKWGRGRVEVIGPKNQINITSSDGGVQTCTAYRPSYEWVTDDQGSICFNTEENMPSHVLMSNFEPSLDKDYAYITLTVGDGSPVIVWAKYAQPISETDAGGHTESFVYIKADDLPQIVYKIVGGVEEDVTAPIYWYIPKSTPGKFAVVTKLSTGYLKIPAVTGETTEIFLRVGYVESEKGDNVQGEDRYVFNNISTSIPNGFGYAGDRWTIVANDSGYNIGMNIPELVGDAETYALDQDTYGTYFFRRIYENWLRAVPIWYEVEEVNKDGNTETVNKYGELRISDRATAGAYAVVYRAYPEENGKRVERLYVVLLKIIDRDIDAPLCKFTKRTSPNGLGEELYLSDPAQKNLSISEIEWNRKVRLVQSPILTKSSQFNYIIDLGNLEYLSFKVTRTQPEVIDDSDTCYDQAKWSNQKWVNTVKTYFDQWQNANYNKDGRRSGGYNLIFDPLIGYKNFPRFNKNVFLAAPLDFEYGRSISLIFKFIVASMLGRNAVSPKTAYFKYETNQGNGDIGTLKVQYYSDMLIAPEIPVDAAENTITWSIYLPDEKNEPRLHYFEPGTEIIGQLASGVWDESRNTFVQDATPTFTAVRGTNRGTIFVFDSSKSWIIAADAINRRFGIGFNEDIWVSCFGVGGGGSGGPSEAYVAVDNRDRPWLSEYYIGGGGGSGHQDRRIRKVVGPKSFYITLGKGGEPGKDGGTTTVDMGGFNVLHVNGGDAGQMKAAGKGDAKGGENTSFAHWTLRRWGEDSDIKGSNGEPNANREGVSEDTVIGGAATTSLNGETPGSGGGAVNTPPIIITGSYWVPSVDTQGDLKEIQLTSPLEIRSEGGSMTGLKDRNRLSESSARYGGGGCSKLVKPERNSTQTITNTVVSGLRAVANGVLAIVSSVGSGPNMGMDALEKVGNPGSSFVRFGSEGNRGADGFVKIDFITLGGNTSNGE